MISENFSFFEWNKICKMRAKLKKGFKRVLKIQNERFEC